MENEKLDVFNTLCDKLKTKEKELTDKIYAIDTGVSAPKPIADGIINIEKYLSAKYKILWILKEAYDDDSTGESRMGGWHLCNYINRCKRKDFIKRAIGRRELKVSSAILSDISDEVEAFKSTAVIEIKKIPNGRTKSGGGKPSNWNDLQRAYNEHKTILLEQITTYSPEVVICGNTLQFFEKDLNYKEGISKKLGLGNHSYYCLKERVYINAYHPSYPKISDEKYVSAIYNAFIDWRNNYCGKEN